MAAAKWGIGLLKEYEKNKVDLHLHLDGSLPYSVIPALGALAGVPVDAGRIPEQFTVKPGCRSLEEYFQCFYPPEKLLQKKECLSLATETLVRELYEDHVLTAELRFAPQRHKKEGLDGSEIVEGAIAGMDRALACCPGMKCGLILCMMIGGSKDDNAETVELAGKYLGKGVAALDIAGAEGMIPLTSYEPYFRRAEELGVPYTIHAGECGDWRNIETALDLGAKRIGHGVAAIYDQDTIKRLAETKTPIEVCITSNLQTKAIPETEVHPVKKLLDAGVIVTINTDNMTVSGTNLSKEYELLMDDYGFTKEDILRVQENGRKASFLT